MTNPPGKATTMTDLQGVLDDLKEQIRMAGSQKAWAEENSIAKSHVCDVLKGKSRPNKKMLLAIGYVREYAYSELYPDQGDGVAGKLNYMREGRSVEKCS